MTAEQTATDWLRNPTTGARLALYCERPRVDTPPPAVVIAPGGLGSGREALAAPVRQQLLQRGIAVVRFDPDGRGRSEGVEDRCGPAQQAGMAAVLRWVTDRADLGEIGVLSLSFGLAMSVGALQQTGPGVRWLVDWEGPSSRRWIAGYNRPTPFSIFGDVAEDDDAFWRPREAVSGIGSLSLAYNRLQAQHDHVHGLQLGHAAEMLAAAREGKPHWVGLNGSEAASDRLPPEVLSDLPAICQAMFTR